MEQKDEIVLKKLREEESFLKELCTTLESSRLLIDTFSGAHFYSEVLERRYKLIDRINEIVQANYFPKDADNK